MAKSKVSGIITVIVLLLVLALIISLFAYFSSCFRTKPSTFYIEINDKPITEDSEGIHISRKDTVKVVTLNDSYDVSIYAHGNAANDFDFACKDSDGNVSDHTWKELDGKDFTYLFIRKEISDRMFSIDYGALTDIIRGYYHCNEVNVSDMEKLTTVDRFSMVVKSGTASITVYFSIDNSIPVTSITISPDNIVF